MKEKKSNSIWRVSAYLFRYKGLFALTLGLAITSTIFLILIPQVVGWAFDNYISAAEMQKLIYAVGVLVAMFLGRELFNSLRIRANNVLEQKVLIDLRSDLHAKLLDLPVSFYDKRKSGEISSRVVEDVDNVERALLDGTEQGTVALLTIIGISVILFVENSFLAMFVCAPLPILLALGINHSRVTRKNWAAVRESAGNMNSLLVEDIQGNRLIHSFALKKRERTRFHENAKDLRNKTLKAMFRWAKYGPASDFVSQMGMVAVVGVGGYLTITQPEAFTMGDLLKFLFYCNFLYAPLSRLQMLNHMLAAGRASGDRVFEILDHDLEITPPEKPQDFPKGLPEAVYSGVDFKYPGRDDILSDFTLTLPAGKVTALVGHTGAGKSTVANLLMRYYDVSNGGVVINGTDVRTMDPEDLRANIGHVAQDPFLFEGSVRDNLMLAQNSASEEALISALKGACAWEFVEQLPNGLDTNIGEKGIRLSQGEKQRLTIARVLLKNPSLVILDEATASVDTLTESLIQQALANLMQERTVLVIAHRLSTIRDADQIVVLEHGRIIEKGNHDELLDQAGHYSRLWNRQADQIPESI